MFYKLTLFKYFVFFSTNMSLRAICKCKSILGYVLGRYWKNSRFFIQASPWLRGCAGACGLTSGCATPPPPPLNAPARRTYCRFTNWITTVSCAITLLLSIFDVQMIQNFPYSYALLHFWTFLWLHHSIHSNLEHSKVPTSAVWRNY